MPGSDAYLPHYGTFAYTASCEMTRRDYPSASIPYFDAITAIPTQLTSTSTATALGGPFVTIGPTTPIDRAKRDAEQASKRLDDGIKELGWATLHYNPCGAIVLAKRREVITLEAQWIEARETYHRLRDTETPPPLP